MHDKAKLRHDQGPGGIEVIFVPEFARELEFLLPAQHRYSFDSLDIGFQAADGACKNQVPLVGR